MAAQAPPPQDVNPICLKVMRLCKPSFHFSLPVPFPPAAPAAGDPEPGIALSPMLALPQSFGDIYLGETFSCYISLCNIAPVELAHVGLKVEVQTQLQRETLSDSSAAGSAIARFASQQTLDKIIEYDLKDVGIHILICSALYTDSAGERKYFRKVRARPRWSAPALRCVCTRSRALHAARTPPVHGRVPPRGGGDAHSHRLLPPSQFFKFQVNNPLSMKSKTHALAPHNEVRAPGTSPLSATRLPATRSGSRVPRASVLGSLSRVRHLLSLIAC